MGVSGLEAAKALPGIIDMGFTMAQGTVVKTMDHGANRPGFVVSQGQNRSEAVANAERAFNALDFDMK